MTGTHSKTSTRKEENQPKTVTVWDPLVRTFHWGLAVSFVIAYVMEDDFMTAHVWAGYAAGTLIVIRILWGFVGTKHARFSDFLFGPKVTLKYLADLVRLKGNRCLGHSPAGGAMTLALLASMSVTILSGLVLYAVEENKGPFATFMEQTLTEDMRQAQPDGFSNHKNEYEDDYEDDEHEFWEEVHEIMANVTLVLVLIHIGGVVLAGIAHNENIAKSMITGRKRTEDGEN